MHYRRTLNVQCPGASHRFANCARSVTLYRRQRCMLVVAVVHSRLDYSNGVLVGLPFYLTRQLQPVLNAAARLTYRLKTCDHITDAFICLHWLRVPERIQYKRAVLAYKLLHGGAPSLPPHINISLLQAPFVRTLFGARSFSVAALNIYNSLPPALRTCTLQS